MRYLLTIPLLLLTLLSLAQAPTLTPSLRRPTVNGAKTLNLDTEGFPILTPKTGSSERLKADPVLNRITSFYSVTALQSSPMSLSLAPMSITLTDQKKQGVFVLDATDSSTPDNNGATTVRTASNLCYKRAISGGVDAGWFCRGDGVVDDKANLQAAIAYAASIYTHVYDTGSPIYKVTGGIVLDRNITGITLNGTITATGSSYTVVSTDLAFSWKRLQLNIEGNNNAVTGVVLNTPLNSTIQAIRVHRCAGAGLRIIKAYDTVFENISIELCGSNSEYAFSVEDGDDTSNMLNILRLQVELSAEKAIYISPNTLSSNISSIHSERQKVTGSVKDTWLLGGSNCSYHNVRLNARSDSSYREAYARAHIYGAMVTVNDFRVEGAIPVLAESWAEGLAQVRINQINANYYQKAGNGDVLVQGGYIDNVSGISNRSHFSDVIIDSLNVGYSPSAAFQVELISCRVKHLTSSTTDSHLRAINTTIDEGSFCQGDTYLINSSFVIGTQTAGYRKVYCVNTTLTGNLTTDNGHFEFLSGSKIIGDLTIGANRSVIFDATSYVTGTVTNMGAPESSTFAGGFYKGQRTWNPAPTVSGTEYWVCTTAGTGGSPGTWTAH